MASRKRSSSSITAPAPAAFVGCGRGLCGPVERAGHLERERFPAWQIEKLVRDLVANGAQVPVELGIGGGVLGAWGGMNRERRHGVWLLRGGARTLTPR